MRAVILCGGKGTRMRSVEPDLPKSMVKIGSLPLLEHQILLLKKYGITEVWLITGHLSSVIENYFGNGSQWGISVRVHPESKALGTAGAIKQIESKFLSTEDENFILLYGDLVLEMDLEKFLNFHQGKKGICTVAIHPNDHPHDSDLLELGQNEEVIALHPKPHPPEQYFRNQVNAGVYALSVKVFHQIEANQKLDLVHDLFPGWISQRLVYGYQTAEYIKDMGTPDRLEKVRRDFESGRVKDSHRSLKRRTIFLDRDGVINQDKDMGVFRVEDFQLEPGAGKAVKILNETGFRVVVVTNQSVIAKNLCSLDTLDTIHKKMETLVGREGGFFDKIYFCPHHPSTGFPGERAEFKINCECRKPKIGMFQQAQQDFNIDVSHSFIIGDSYRDILFGKNAGIQTIGVRTGSGCLDGEIFYEPDYFFSDLQEAARFLADLGVNQTTRRPL